MRRADELTIEEQGIPGLVLMENAGFALYGELKAQWAPLSTKRIAILCGKGNNGGDGLVLARQLRMHDPDARLSVFLFADPELLSPDARANYEIYRKMGGLVEILPDEPTWEFHAEDVVRADVIVDALLGTGLTGPARGLLGRIIQHVNKRCPGAGVLSVDLPSGMPSDIGSPAGDAMRSDACVTFTAPKPAQVFGPNAEKVGALTVAPIGTSREIRTRVCEPWLAQVEASDFATLLRPRAASGHKGTYGHVIAIGGSGAKPGAISMTGEAALRAGAGLVTVATPRSAARVVTQRTPELMTMPLADADDGSISAEAYSPQWWTQRTVAAVGPAIGTDPENQALVRKVVRECPLPLVVDADGLTALAAEGEGNWGTKAPYLVLTPHPGEMGRLVGLPASEVEDNRVEFARRFASERGVYLVLKGHRTLIATPSGDVLVNPTGAPAMATAGSGDVLTGLIAGLLAQFPSTEPQFVIAAAVYLHGLAGERGAEELGEKPLLATDMISYLPEALREAEARLAG